MCVCERGLVYLCVPVQLHVHTCVCLHVYMGNYVCTCVCVDVQREEGVRDLTYFCNSFPPLLIYLVHPFTEWSTTSNRWPNKKKNMRCATRVLNRLLHIMKKV